MVNLGGLFGLFYRMFVLGFADSMAFTVFFIAVLEYTVTTLLIDWCCQSYRIILDRVKNSKNQAKMGFNLGRVL
ncbi:hypothetical protein GYM75_04875 [Gilliamella sp. ESL0441]|uniref:hypothetical protein n=1 Tax=Gilliamella sp. ESL0441 TaxID=2704654 RepID=UPI001C697EAA|nr:hypothetical protein [Gilliamella sp. ESL0441]QYN44228.1 hypothetical protein GYM75_04875 [Gilliamella sp. ESL0441]